MRFLEGQQYIEIIFKGKLQNGDISCTDVLRAYQRAALSSTERTNCVCMFMEVDEGSLYVERKEKQLNNFTTFIL
ncbi:hypothetical protein NECAME_05390 [Necator americanus]|uniref:Uncharacterized protein n=1 Tax=Necator americanus TaxID=51031 RepID=W2SH15_NECAM|nr:hypothetical protein NECAME_05390 [Necator americanus]ETN68934.1 hypothetical protein NECAME_05390 [Necator americanus]